MKINIKGEQPWQVPSSHSCGISPSEEGYTLQYSVDGENYTSYSDAVPANETCLVINFPKYTFFRCSGNNSDLIISY